jgi:hypothetical protein
MADSGDRLTLLWEGGVTECIYADDRNGGRIIEDILTGPQLMNRSEFGKHALRPGEGRIWGGPLDDEYDRLLAAGLVDDTTNPEDPHATS